MFKPNTSFASRVQRFQGASEMMGGTQKEDLQVPGPGQYHHESHWGKTKRSSHGQWSKGTGAPGLPVQNPPSIPSHNNIFGYEENARGELIKQKNTESVFTGLRDDKVGPAEYQIEVKKTTRGPTKWHKEEEPTQL